jgi:hypothetical protein
MEASGTSETQEQTIILLGIRTEDHPLKFGMTQSQRTALFLSKATSLISDIHRRRHFKIETAISFEKDFKH